MKNKREKILEGEFDPKGNSSKTKTRVYDFCL